MGSTQFLTAKLAFSSYQERSYSFSNRIPNKESTIILDWDDTLMSTTYLLGKNKILNEEDIKVYKLLGEEVKKFITLCK